MADEKKPCKVCGHEESYDPAKPGYQIHLGLCLRCRW